VVNDVESHSPAHEAGEPLQDFLWAWAVDDEVFERLAGDAEADPIHALGCDLELDLPGLVDEYAVARVGQIEGHVLVCLLRTGAAVSVPHVDRLAVLHERTEPFSEAVDVFTDAQRKRLGHEVPHIAAVASAARPLYGSHALRAAAGENPTVRHEVEAPGAGPMNLDRKPARLKARDRFACLNADVGRLARIHRKLRPVVSHAGVVRDANADDVDRWGGQFDGQGRQVVHLGAVLRRDRRRQHGQRVVRDRDAMDHRRVKRTHAVAQQPIAIPELHRSRVLPHAPTSAPRSIEATLNGAEHRPSGSNRMPPATTSFAP
jgi:hypothetical protein